MKFCGCTLDWKDCCGKNTYGPKYPYNPIPATNPMPKVEPEKLTIEARLARIENILERMLHRNY